MTDPIDTFPIGRTALNLFQVRFFERLNEMLLTGKISDELREELEVIAPYQGKPVTLVYALENAIERVLVEMEGEYYRSIENTSQGRRSIRKASQEVKTDIKEERARNKLAAPPSQEIKDAKYNARLARTPLEREKDKIATLVDGLIEEIRFSEGSLLSRLASGKYSFLAINNEHIHHNAAGVPASQRDLLLRAIMRTLETMECNIPPSVREEMLQDWNKSFLTGSALEQALRREEEKQRAYEAAAQRAKTAAAPMPAAESASPPVVAAPSPPVDPWHEILSKSAREVVRKATKSRGVEQLVAAAIAEEIKALKGVLNAQLPEDVRLMKLLTSDKFIKQVEEGLTNQRPSPVPAKKIIEMNTDPVTKLLKEAPQVEEKLRLARPALLTATAGERYDSLNELIRCHSHIIRVKLQNGIPAEATLSELERVRSSALSGISPAGGIGLRPC